MVQIPIKVQTSSKAGELVNPVSFAIRDRTFQVMEVVDSWHGADHAYYKLIADDGNLYVIKHDMDADAWELVQMEVITGS
ncbi:MAG TPA: hypothetical protein VJ161_04950 [Geobacteraceae bacterium]|jgi:hypothetical protein|nr:hypothetical protein [Geobacteraceae bacterium]